MDKKGNVTKVEVGTVSIGQTSTVTLGNLSVTGKKRAAGGEIVLDGPQLSLADAAECFDMLGLPRTAEWNAVGAVAADPADRPLSGYAAWAAERGFAGADAAWDAKPARWGGTWANAFVYTFGEGLVDGTTVLLDISVDSVGNPVLATAPVVEGHDDFTFRVIGAPALDDWSEPVFLERNGNDWTLPVGESAHFSRVRLRE